MGIAVVTHQSQDLLACFAGGENQGNLDALAWTESQALAQAEDRVQDKTLAVAKLLEDPHRIRERPSSADESAPLGFELQGFVLGVFKRKAVRNVNGWVVFRARAAVREERLMFRYRLGLGEQLVEGRMLPVCVERRQREFNVAREIETAGAKGPIDQGDPPNLNVVFWRDDDLRFGLNAVIGAPEHGTVEREVGGVRLNLPAHWVIRVGPHSIRVGLLYVAEGSPRVLSPIRPPACDLKVAPPTVSPAGVRDHQAIATIAKELGFGRARMGGIEFAHRGRDFADALRQRHSLSRGDVVQRRQDRDAFMEQGLNGTHACVGMKMALDRIAIEEVGQRQETHALMMRQVGLNDHPTLALT